MSETIYVKKVDEHEMALRPVLAEKLQPEVYKILPSPANQIPNGERWEFAPGSVVEVQEKLMDDHFVKVAITSNFIVG